MYPLEGSTETIVCAVNTEIEVADQVSYLTKSEYADTEPARPSSYNARRLAG